MDWCGSRTDWLKECFRCKKEFWVKADDFTAARELMMEFFSPRINAGSADELQSYCKKCKTVTKHATQYGVNRDEVLLKQDNKCAICACRTYFNNASSGANMDHDHKTNKTRGVLCQNCNKLMVAVDNDEWLAKAIAYRDLYRCG